MRAPVRWLLSGAVIAALAGAAHAGTITIVNADGAGEGFNDPTPAAPVGGNPGTTIGAQRLFVFQHAASIWGGILPDNITIRVNAQFNPLSCTATSGVLGGAGPIQVFRDFPNAPFSSTWYHVALANRLANSDLDGGTVDDISATFNSAVGGSSCLPQGWYYGVDGNEGSAIELLPVVLHELGHGLGFSTTTDGSTGAYLGTAPGFPGAYDHFLFDDTQHLVWTSMTQAQRAASAINCLNLAWSGSFVTAKTSSRLGPKPLLRVTSPAPAAGDYNVGLPTFGPALTSGGVTGQVVLANDTFGNPTNACEAMSGSLAGKIALVDRGTCTFTVKVKNCQNAGAIGVIVADSLPGCPPVGMGGTDATITIPSVRITQSDGATLKANLGAGVTATLLVDPAQRAGTDGSGRLLVYTPNPYQGGSSVSHWDTSAEPSLLMEPAITPGLSSDPDLTVQAFEDLGWFNGVLGVPATPSTATLSSSVPNPTNDATAISYSLPADGHVRLRIFDLNGRLVTELVNARRPQGRYTVRWNGRRLDGTPASAGVYLYRLETPGFSEARTLVIVR